MDIWRNDNYLKEYIQEKIDFKEYSLNTLKISYLYLIFAFLALVLYIIYSVIWCCKKYKYLFHFSFIILKINY